MTSLLFALFIRGLFLVKSAIPHIPAGVSLRQELRLVRTRDGYSSQKLLTNSSLPKTIALTFDDGPHPAWTPALLSLLSKLRVQATFFVVGRMVDKNPWLVRAEVALGHEVGNHTYDHYNLDLLSEPQIVGEYRACSDAVQRATGVRPKFCRPPGGRFDRDVVRAAESEGMWTVLWTDDPGDFTRPDTKTLLSRIDHQIKNGGILLLHDGIPQTIHILPKLVYELRKRGYRFVTCSELLAEKQRLIVHNSKKVHAT